MCVLTGCKAEALYLDITNGIAMEMQEGDEQILEVSTNIDELHWTTSNPDIATVDATGKVVALAQGTVTITVYHDDLEDYIYIVISPNDPYKDINVEDFYKTYEPANSAIDAHYRSLHHLMSGQIEAQDQHPTMAENRPKDENGLFYKNNVMSYSDDGNAYDVYDDEGNLAFTVYKGGAYVTLEEVAAYVFAFGDVPANYTEDKYETTVHSKWGQYLRLNHTYFSGDTNYFPYEPVLPNIQGCGGDLYYYEMDIGTTGTDCDPAYPSLLYNDGSIIHRGAARIVYSRYNQYQRLIEKIEDRYLFYTYNHYNDFQEYLNYENGWGDMFGNITGGGVISSREEYAPTDYIPTILKNLFGKNAF